MELNQLFQGRLEDGLKLMSDGINRTILIEFDLSGYREIWIIGQERLMISKINNYSDLFNSEPKDHVLEYGSSHDLTKLLTEGFGFQEDDFIEIVELM